MSIGGLDFREGFHRDEYGPLPNKRLVENNKQIQCQRKKKQLLVHVTKNNFFMECRRIFQTEESLKKKILNVVNCKPSLGHESENLEGF